jgi:hypothetical protein
MPEHKVIISLVTDAFSKFYLPHPDGYQIILKAA